MQRQFLSQSKLWLVGLTVGVFTVGCSLPEERSATPSGAEDVTTTVPERPPNAQLPSAQLPDEPSPLDVQADVEAEAIAQWLTRSAAADKVRPFYIRSDKSWGFENMAIISDADSTAEVPASFLRVQYPAGSASPSVSRRSGGALGGAQFYADIDSAPQDRLRLSYRVRFSEDFDFVKGGKLPGLFGGAGASGGASPDGTDGFSARLMWRREGQGEVYAYLPTSEGYGTSIGRGAWRFRPGEWTTVEQEITLNQPGQTDGRIQLWVDGNLVVDEPGLIFRTADSLQLDGLFFSTFFGGGDSSWATPQDVHIDFADFVIEPVAP